MGKDYRADDKLDIDKFIKANPQLVKEYKDLKIEKYFEVTCPVEAYIFARKNGFTSKQISNFTIFNGSHYQEVLSDDSVIFFDDMKFLDDSGKIMPVKKQFKFMPKGMFFLSLQKRGAVSSFVEALYVDFVMPILYIKGAMKQINDMPLAKSKVMAEKIVDKYKGTSPHWTLKGIPDVI